MTFVQKRLFPILWISGFGFGTCGLWMGIFTEPTPPPPEMKWVFLGAWIAGSGFILWFVRRLKAVWLEDDHLLVSDYTVEELIPLRNIEEVTETRFWNPKMIKLRLRQPCRWGEEIVFMAPASLQLPFSDHRVVKELRERAAQASMGRTTR
ncbi:MAG TPA: hypothetical protein VFQ38_00475 [Longimicrobiales bacterium]|nr:hypothetical protein [Longimicrobiales bacterium]